LTMKILKGIKSKHNGISGQKFWKLEKNQILKKLCGIRQNYR